MSISQKAIEKPMIFITGCPRSGTSLLTKVIDAHPQISIFMENIFFNRRRLSQRAKYWSDDMLFKQALSADYEKLVTPVVGNKVCTPDVWLIEDIKQFCIAFSSFKILFIVRDPRSVVMSRLKREKGDTFNEVAKKKLSLSFETTLHTYISSWVQSIKIFSELRDEFPTNIKLIYYEDFCDNFINEVTQIFQFLNIDISDEIFYWDQLPHTNNKGNLEKNLKYKDHEIIKKVFDEGSLPQELSMHIENIQPLFQSWVSRNI